MTDVPTTTHARAAWEDAAAAVARRSGLLADDSPDAAVWEALTHRTVEGLPVPPLGIPHDPPRGLPEHDEQPEHDDHPAHDDRRGGWDVRSHLADADPERANAAALADLAGGATSLWVTVGDGGLRPEDLPAALEGVQLDIAPVILDTRPDGLGTRYDAMPAADAFRDLVGRSGDSSGVAAHPDSSLGADPIGAAARALTQRGKDTAAGSTAVGSTAAVAAETVEPARLATELGIGAVVADGTAVHESGAGDADELAYLIASAAAYLRALAGAGYTVDKACRLISLRVAVTDEQFTQIAKLRAARLLWARITELSGASTATPHRPRIHAVTSAAMFTRYDPWVNLLRGTVAGFAAAAGGADAVTVLPFDVTLGTPEEFSHRMARNVSALLAGEAHLDTVADPAGGSFAIEQLTRTLAEAAWDRLGKIERTGGVLEALAGGPLAASIAATSAERDRRVATREQSITGVSEFPLLGETAADLPERRDGSPTRACRWAEPFEALRDSPPDKAVLLITIGTPARAQGRVQYISNVLAAGGVRVVEPAAASDTADPAAGAADTAGAADAAVAAGAAGAVRESGCRTVVLAGVDTDYRDHVADVIAAVRGAGAAHVFVAGRSRSVLASLPDHAVDGAIKAGDDVLAFLTTVRETLGDAS